MSRRGDMLHIALIMLQLVVSTAATSIARCSRVLNQQHRARPLLLERAFLHVSCRSRLLLNFIHSFTNTFVTTLRIFLCSHSRKRPPPQLRNSAQLICSRRSYIRKPPTLSYTAADRGVHGSGLHRARLTRTKLSARLLRSCASCRN